MENAKEKAIREAYGEHWETVKNYVDNNGWISTKGETNPIELGYNIWHDIQTKDGSNKKEVLFRPKSLQGIETNNNWIRIESENDLPKEYNYFYLKLESGDEVIAYNSLHKRLFVDCDDEIEYRFITHYQPIIKPLKPIY